MPILSSSVHFRIRKPGASRTWLPYFLAAFGAGVAVADEELLRYHWVMPEAAPEKATRVIRVSGEKGERFEEVYAEETLAELKQNPAIMEARIARQAALRREALELARQLREEGKDPLVAYEEAWTQVYSRSWLSGGWLSGSCKLEDMLRRMASEGEEQELTEEERQWLLEALLEDDDRLESEAGQELLRRLAAQLRQKGYGFSTVSSGLNDELMQRFAAGLQHQTDSMDAYRDALFKTRRGQIMTHSLVGYRAPWGMGVGGGAYYRQAPQQVETTEGSGNTQMPAQPVLLQEKKEPIIVHGLNDVPEAVTDFLATAPPSLEEEDNDEKEKEEDDDFLADDESESEAAAPAMMMMRSFSMRSAAYAVQNEGEADAPESPDSPVHGGVVELAQDEILDVGANRVVGGSLAGGRLENVQMVVTGELYRPVSKDYVTVHNLITSADGTNPGILTDVTLYAGTSTEYATLHNITFAGQSELTGYITFEKTQATSDMSVAAGGTLTLKNLTFDLRGVSMDEKTLFVIEDGGTLEGWNAYNVHFVYSGVKVNSAAVALSERKGVIVLSDDHNGNLYWNGAADNMWSVSSKNWSSTAGGAVYEEFTALSNVIFGKDAARDARAISVAQDMVVADLYVTDGGYSFSGARVAVLGDAKFTHESGTVTFNDHLVVQGNLTTGDRERAEYADSVALLGGATIVKDAVFSNLTTTIGGDMTVGGDLNVLSGNLTITGNVTAKEMELVVNGGSASVSGNLTTTTITENKLGSITIGGTAEQRYTGTVTAGDLTVNTQKNDVYFSRLQVDKLTVGEGATVHVQTSSDSVAVSSSKFPVIDLTGTLVLDAPGVTYNDRHSVYVKSDAAKLKFDSGCTVEDLQIFGMADNSGDFNYTDLAIEVTNSSSATVTKMQALGTLEVTSGSLTVKDATGAVHGKLILDKAKLKLGAGADDIMADGSGAVELKNGARLDIGSTTQTLSAGNAISLSGASSITGAADGGGLKLRDDSLCVNYENTGNSIDANLTVAAGQTITLNSASANSSLEISGSISGSGDIVLGNSDSETENVPGTVVLYGANTGFKGKVTVYDGSTLTLLNTEALSNASGVVLEFGGTLALNAPGAVNLNALTFKSGSSLSISSIVGTDAASSKDAVLNVNDNSLKLDNVVLNLNFSQELQSMQTYNIMTGVSSIDNLSFNVTHNNDVKLDVSQYKVVLDGNLLYIHTMMGNVWDGSYSENWTLTGNGGNWSGDEYQQGEGVKYTAAIFGDLTTDGQTQSTETVKVKDEVSPGNVYFTADTTAYQLDSDGGGLAAGTRIHKLGKADVTLGLANNATEGTALGNVDIQAGSLILGKGLAVKGTVTVEKDANLQLKYGSGGLTMFAKKDDEAFSVSAIGEDALLRGVTMDAAGIRGTKDVYNAAIEDDIKAAEINASNLLVQGNAELQYLILKDFAAAGNVTLSDVTLTSSSTATTLTGVTIGSGVKVDASGSYILSGKNLTFDSALTNKGTVTLDIVTDIDNENLTIIEIGKINYDTRVDTYGNTEYVYEFISSTNGGVLYAPALSADNFSINGVNLGSGLKDKDGVKFTDNRNGSITLSIYDGTVSMPQWDERWGKTKNAPAFSRRYESTATDTFTQASGIGGDAKYVSLAWGIVVDATKQSHDATYFKYGSIVNETNAKRVNDGKAIVVTLTSDAKGDLVVGGNIAESEAAAADHEVWIYDSSGVRTIIGGLTNNKIDPGTSDSPGSSVTTPQTAATHILVDSKVTNDKIHVDGIPETDYAKEYIIGGSRWCNQDAESFVTVKSGHIYNIFGGSCGGWHGQLVYDNYGYVTKRLWGFENGYVDWTVWVYDETLWRNVPYLTQTGTAHVYVDGGTVGEIFAGGFYANIIGTQKVEGKERPRAVEMVLTGGTIGGPDLRVFGGTDHGVVTGDIYVRMEGSANVTSILVGGSNAGVVKGDVVLDLISGTANKVEAPGKGWDEGNDLAQIYGDVLVNLYSGFKLGKGIIEYNNPNVDDLECGIFGGMEQSNHVKILKENAKSTLHFAEGGATYTLGAVNSDGYTDSANSSIVTGFDAFSLEDKAHVVLALGKFDVDMDPSKTLAISGKGVVEVIGRGSNFGRNIELQKSATLKISTCDIGTGGIGDVRTITVTDGTTVDFTGFSITGLDPATPGKAGLDFNVKICGNGVDGKGALYMGQSTQTADDTNANVNEIYLPKVELTGSASVKVVAQEALYMDSIKLAGNTLTKLGAGDFITHSVEKVDEKTTGTILVQQGTFGVTKTTDAAATDMVLAAGAKLKLNATAPETTAPETTDPETTDTADLTLRSLSGAGTVELNGSTLTLQTVEDSAYYTEYMPVEYTGGSTSYDQFLGTTGFGYAVFSGLIKDDGKLVKDGKGVHYILGSSNTYTGGTELKNGRLYLLGTSTSEDFTKGAASVSSGVAGTGDIEWTGSAAELYLGHGAHIYNNGTVSGEGAVITIGVEGALKGVLADFCKGTTKVTKGEDTYVVIDTHNLKSIAVDALYADGTAYTAGTEIDRSKMLLVKDSSVNATAVTFLSANGYNEAYYSGFLSGNAALRKVGEGTLDLDQTNSYSGEIKIKDTSYTVGTLVEAGTLRLRGWGTVGSGAVQVNAGSSLMLTYIGGYGEDETKSLANDIYLYGNGDEQWKAHDSTSKQTAALISTLEQAVEFTLSGDITGDGGVLHSGEGTLVLNGDSSYTGGTVITRGVVDVQSAKGLGSTANGAGAVVLGENADLHVTVEDGTTGSQLVTTLASVEDEILGDVSIVGTESTERILHMADNGYSAATTTLGENGTLLLRGAPIKKKGVSAESDLLTGKGSVVVSDPTGSGATASFGTITDYTGDFRVEGDKASIQVKNGSYSEGSIAVSGQQASVQIGGNVSIEAGESLQLSSTGLVPDQTDKVDMGTGAVLVSHGMVSVAAGAELSAIKAETVYAYDDISKLEKAASVTVKDVVLADDGEINAYHQLDLDDGVLLAYKGRFDADIAINQQAVAGVKADVGLTLAGGSTYRTDSGHISLMGGSLTLDTLADNQLTFNTVLDVPYETLYGKVQLVLFSEVSSVKFIYGDITETAQEPGVYYTSADYFLTGCDYIDSQTMLVYDSHAGVVYLEMKVPEPTTTTLGLVALAAMAARRRRKRD